MNIIGTVKTAEPLSGSVTSEQGLTGAVSATAGIAGSVAAEAHLSGDLSAEAQLSGDVVPSGALGGNLAMAYGTPGRDGKDGYTPVKGIDYFDGKDGQPGKDGKDGYTPVKGVDYFDGLPGKDGSPGKDGKDGLDGQPGKDGYTPVKGLDYFDGLPGEPGKDGYTPVKGVDYFDGLPGADGKDGSPGADGQPGKDGYSPVRGTDYWTTEDIQKIVTDAVNGILAQKAMILEVAYPVGAIYMSTVSTNPKTLLGFGTWEQIKDRFLLASGSTYAAGNTGGTATHTHEYRLGVKTYYGSPIGSDYDMLQSYDYVTGTNKNAERDGNADNPKINTALANSNKDLGTTCYQQKIVGNTKEETNMPPYLAVYVWKRTA